MIIDFNKGKRAIDDQSKEILEQTEAHKNQMLLKSQNGGKFTDKDIEDMMENLRKLAEIKGKK